MPRRYSGLALFAVLVFALRFEAQATPVAVGFGHWECYPTGGQNFSCCVRITYDNTSFDVYGTPVNLGTSVGSATSVASGTYDQVTQHGTFSATFDSEPPGTFGFQSVGNFICSGTTCSFVGPLDTFTGTFSLPSGPSYTQDGTPQSQPSPTYPLGCNYPGSFVYEGPVGANAFQQVATPTGSNVTVPTSDTFYDSATGNSVTVSLDVSFADVSGAGETVVSAYSNAAAQLSSNFTAQVSGVCSATPSVTCCTDTDCPGADTCNGCYRAAYVDVTTTASISGPITLCSSYPDADDDGVVDGTSIDEGRLSFFHDEGGTFVDRTASRDPDNNRICAEVSSLSFFVVAAGEFTCPAAPRDDCRGAAKSVLVYRNNGDDSKDSLVWKWLKGAGTTAVEFGSPTTNTADAVCVYGGPSSTLLGTMKIPAGSLWSGVGNPASGYKYKDPSSAQGGAKVLLLKSGTATKSKLIVKGKGLGLPDLGDPTAPVTVQLIQSTSDTCWQSVFDGADVIKDDGVLFKAIDQ